MRVLEEVLLQPMVKLRGGPLVPHDPKTPGRIDHYASRLVVEIEGRKAVANARHDAALVDMGPRETMKRSARYELQQSILAFIAGELFK